MGENFKLPKKKKKKKVEVSLKIVSVNHLKKRYIYYFQDNQHLKLT